MYGDRLTDDQGVIIDCTVIFLPLIGLGRFTHLCWTGPIFEPILELVDDFEFNNGFVFKLSISCKSSVMCWAG